MKLRPISIALLVVLLYGQATGQRQSRFTSQFRKPATEAGLFYVQRHGGIVMDPEDGFDPRALVLSFDSKPITQESNYPDAPTIPGFYLSPAARFDFERIRVVGTRVYFTTRTVGGVHYQFSGTIGTQRINDAQSSRLSFIKGVLTRFSNRRVISQEEIKFVRV